MPNTNLGYWDVECCVRHCAEALVYSNHPKAVAGEPPRIWPYSSGGLSVAYPGSAAQQRTLSLSHGE